VPKNAYFLEKIVKSAAASGARPRTSICLRRLRALPPDSRVATTACCCSTLSVYSRPT